MNRNNIDFDHCDATDLVDLRRSPKLNQLGYERLAMAEYPAQESEDVDVSALPNLSTAMPKPVPCYSSVKLESPGIAVGSNSGYPRRTQLQLTARQASLQLAQAFSDVLARNHNCPVPKTIGTRSCCNSIPLLYPTSGQPNGQ